MSCGAYGATPRQKRPKHGAVCCPTPAVAGWILRWVRRDGRGVGGEYAAAVGGKLLLTPDAL